MASQQRALIRLADTAEDVASGLHLFRDGLPSNATRITAVISELFALSSALRKLDEAQSNPRHEPSFYRIEKDVKLVFPSLQFTLDDAFAMFGRARDRPQQMVWDDLEHRMRVDERVGLLERLEWYHVFLKGLFERLDGVRGDAVGPLRKRIRVLLDKQEVAQLTSRRINLPLSCKRLPREQLRGEALTEIQTAASTPRPGPSRNTSYQRIEMPISPASASDYNPYDRLPPPVPEVPISPTFTTSSSQTLDSSHTSYSNYGMGSMPQAHVQPPVHWAEDVFDGGCPRTPFRGEHILDEDTACYGTSNPDAVRRLIEDGFLMAVEIPFDRAEEMVSLYWRPSDSRARILFVTKDHRGRDQYYCLPLSSLRILRHKSSLQLCQVRKSNGDFKLWARLNFVFHERMVLFYSTFVAMKHQDNREPLDEAVIEDFDLSEREDFGGVIRHGDLLHALRVFTDFSSGVVRLEASPLRGPKQDVPLWTAFITRYAHDPDWLALENGGAVSMIALKPSPYIFLAGYSLPKKRNGEYLLHFATSKDASDFVETWNNLCRTRKR